MNVVQPSQRPEDGIADKRVPNFVGFDPGSPAEKAQSNSEGREAVYEKNARFPGNIDSEGRLQKGSLLFLEMKP